jgi:hypothetical protein
MPATTPPTIDALPTPPQTTDIANFDTRADAFLTALTPWQTDVEAVADNVYDNAAFAESQATAAASSASTATTQAGIATTQASNAAASAVSAINAPGTSGTSTTSTTIGTGSKTLTTQTGKAFVVGQSVTIARTSDPANQRMSGVITAYNSGTGSITVLVAVVFGSGTFTDWTISLGATVVQTASPVGSNVCHNSGFRVNQRSVSGTVTLAANQFGHDRWKAGSSGCTYTFSKTNGITTLNISVGSLLQVIDGEELRTGTYTLSWTGTAQGKIGAGSYSSSGVNGSVTGGTNINIEFNTGTLSQVQFEPGSSPTAYNVIDQTEELLTCQRYLPVTDTVHLNGQAYTTSAAYFHCDFRVPCRIAPTGLLLTGGLSSYSVTNASFSYTAMTGGAISFGSASVGGGSLTAAPSSSIFVAGDASSLLLSSGAKILWTGAEL